MMSFSTVFLPVLIVMFFGLFILKFAYNTCISIKKKNTKWIIINLCCFLFVLVLLILTNKLDHTPLLSLNLLVINYRHFMDIMFLLIQLCNIVHVL